MIFWSESKKMGMDFSKKIWMLQQMYTLDTTTLDRSNEKLRPPLPPPPPPPHPHFNDGKMARFTLRAKSSVILGGKGAGLFFILIPCRSENGKISISKVRCKKIVSENYTF